MKLTGQVKNGKRIYDNLAALSITLHDLEGQRFEETLRRERKVRSTEANRRYFGVILPLVRDCIDRGRVDAKLEPIAWDQDKWKDDLHDQLVRRHAGVEDTVIGPIRKQTHTMDTKQFFDFTESVTRWLAEQGYYVPEEGEE